MASTKIDKMPAPAIGPVVEYKSLADREAATESAKDAAKFRLECEYGQALMQIASGALDTIRLSDHLMARGIDGRKGILAALGDHARALTDANGGELWEHLLGLEKQAKDGVADMAVALAIAFGRKLSDPKKLERIESALEKAVALDLKWNNLSAEEGGIRATRIAAVNDEAREVGRRAYALDKEVEGRRAAGILGDALVADFPWLDTTTETRSSVSGSGDT